MEEKKKTTKSTNSKSTKKSTTKKTSTTAVKKTTKAAPAKKSAPKKTTAKKTTTLKKKQPVKKSTSAPQPKKEKEQKVVTESKTPKIKEKVIETVVVNEPEKNPDFLEKTMIFDKNQNKNIKEVVKKLEEENVVLKNQVIKRKKINKYIIIVLCALIALVIVATGIYVLINENDKETKTLNSNIYEKVIENTKEKNDENEVTIEETNYSNIAEIDLNDFEIKVVEGEKFSVLIFSETCYYCATFEPTINEVLNEQNKKIYKINISEMSDEEVETFRTYYKFSITPTIFTVENGIVTSELLGATNKDEFNTWASENIK